MSKMRYHAQPQRSNSRRPRQHKPVPRRKTTSGWSMKLGAWAHARWREVQYDSVSRRFFQFLSAAVLFAIFTAIFVATGVFTSLGQAVSQKTAQVTRAFGLASRNVNVIANPGMVLTKPQIAEVTAIAGIPDDEIMFNVEPKTIRERIMVLPWVQDVIVRRLWPQSVQIIVTPRKANALWQDNGTLELIDPEGKKLGPADPESAKNLPLVIGENAGIAAPEIFEEIAKRPQVASHTHALIRVEQRRWNIRLKTGGVILLPQDNYTNSLDNLEQLQAQYKLLDRDFARLDVRKPGQLILRPKEIVTRAEAPDATKTNT
ncbi:MAG: cell division protein FtsQ/DivIB [Caulobacterales bacterium]|nr:cell division protein FtsQ/DivIB [Caulobacterales bacterium]MCA0372885.1 cell division protein FtsQ/DivIB [Pseudomonadota bacterium]